MGLSSTTLYHTGSYSFTNPKSHIYQIQRCAFAHLKEAERTCAAAHDGRKFALNRDVGGDDWQTVVSIAIVAVG